MRKASFLLVLLLAIPVISQAQQDEPPDFTAGLRPYDSFHGGQIDSISMTTGSLTIQSPFWSYPQRGGKLALDYALVYNGLNYWIKEHCNVQEPDICTYSWRVRGSKSGVSVEDLQQLGEKRLWVKFVNGTGMYVYSIKTVDGASHPTGLNTSGLWRSLDSTGWLQNLTSSVNTDSSGIRYSALSISDYFFYTREDANGNRITRDTSTLATTDTLGRVIPAIPYWNGGTSGVLSDSSGCTGPRPIAEARVWNLPSPSGGTAVVKFCRVNVPILTNFTEAYLVGSQYSSTFTMIQSIVLPNGKAWTFEYDDRDPGDSPNVNYGQLTKITFPLGGSITYVWRTAGEDRPGNPLRVPINRILDANDGSGPKTWTYTWGFSNIFQQTFTNVMTDPLANDMVITASAFPPSPADNVAFYETQSKFYQGSSTSGTLLKTVNTDFQYSTCAYPLGVCPAAVSVVPTRITTVWPTGQTSKEEKVYDSGFGMYDPSNNGYLGQALYGKVTTQREYDYGLTLMRTTNTAFVFQSNSNYLSNNLLNLASSIQVQDASGVQKAYTTYSYDQYALQSFGVTTQRNANPPTGTYRGNQTAISRWLNTTGTYLTTTTTYFDTGMAYQTTDPLSHPTTFAYGTAFAGAYLTQTTNALSQTSSRNYDFNTGLIVSVTDLNNQMSTFSYDTMNRPDIANFPDGGQIDRDYDDTNRIVTIKTKRTTGGAYIYKKTTYDQLGRAWRDELCEDGAPACAASINTYTEFDALGRQSRVTNPTRCESSTFPSACSGESTFGITKFKYDALSRTTRVIPPDGNEAGDTNVVKTDYLGNTTTVTDQAGKQRRSYADALERLIQVDEPNPTLSTPAVTTYTYDTLDNLLSVVQSSSRQRTFTYNSLSQLTQAVNPESGTINYTYDSDGNLLTKVSPAPNQTNPAVTVTTTFAYDVLHRLKQKSYSDATPLVKYSYDGVTYSGCASALSTANSAGRRTAMCDGAGQESWSYDVVGRVLTDRRTTNSVTKDFSYTYNVDSSTATLVYPSGRTITYGYDNAGRATSGIDAANGINYATAANYGPSGALASMQNGASIVSTFYYNNRLQPCRISVRFSGTAPTNCTDATTGNVLDFTYAFNLGTANNGNVASIANNRAPNRSQSFTYDELNRIKTAQSTATSGGDCWGLQFGYDIWANLLSASVTKCSAPTLALTINTLNRIADTGFTYDAAGNLKNEPQKTYTYDAENHMTQSVVSGVTTAYVYDGDGKRVKKGTAKLYWYGLGADPLEETNASGTASADFIFFGGKRTARLDLPGAAVHYYFANHLGSANVVTSSTGTIQDESDFYPFGGERVVTDTDANAYKFTGKERDTESNLDFFIARYYSSQYGRFISADWSATPIPVPYADFSDPQTLGLYTYVRNNPLLHADVDGHCCSLSDVIDFVGGFINAYGSDNTLGVGRRQQDTTAGKVGAAIGDTVAGIQGVEQAFGGGAAVLALAPADVTPLAPGAALVQGGAAIIAVQGASTTIVAGGNLLKSALSKGGDEPPQLKQGKEAHRAEPIRPGEKPEVPTPSGKGRMDRYNAETRNIREIKPNNPRGHRSGQQQLHRYKEEMETATGKAHTTELTTYPPKKKD